jgi:putative ABC transport system ATP-binding protein
MTDERDQDTAAEIVDLPSVGQRGRTALAEPGSTVGTRFGDAPVVDPASAVPTGLAGLAAPDEKRPRPTAADGRQIVCEGLVRIYKVADLEVVALQGLDLVVNVGEMVAIVGASGSGKSTLLNILGGLDTPSAGRAVVAGHDLGQMGRRERTRYRRRVVGMIWQQTARNLLPYLSAHENVMLPMTLDGRSKRAQRARLLLELVGLGERLDHRPERLSGGEQQRVAIAVALSNQPEVLFADEPTGELDTTTSHEVFELLRRVNEELGTTIVIVTHDALVSEQVQRTVAIRDGRTSTETVRRTALSDTGEHEMISEEFAVLDRAGRLQLPKTHVAALGLKDRVRLRLEGDHVEIWPDTSPSLTRPGNAGQVADAHGSIARRDEGDHDRAAGQRAAGERAPAEGAAAEAAPAEDRA